jgi:general secretion pathway protein A
VPRAELEKRWFGAYRLLWKKPPAGNVMLQVGMRGTDVRWLRERLARVDDGMAATADPALYDEALASAVKALQREHGLVADGVAGARTLIALNNLFADPEIPRLVGAAPTASE